MAARAQRRDGAGRVDPVAVVHGHDVGRARNARAQVRGGSFGRQHDGAGLEHGMRRVERAARGDDGDRRVLALAEPPS